MEDVTDTVFRRIVSAVARPDIFFTEFTGAAGMFGPKGDSIRRRLYYTARETPLIGQIWGNDPESYFRAAAWLREHGFAGVDINMGCPKPKIRKRGYCSALIENRTLARELVLAAREGAGGDTAHAIPVSVKTRIGLSSPVTEDWIGFLLELEPAAVTVHGRTARDLSEVPCNWVEIAKAVALRNAMKRDTVIIGNGDIVSTRQIAEAGERYGVDGVMIGRGIFANLSIFSGRDFHQLPPSQRVAWMRRHFRLFRRQWGSTRNYHTLKKFVAVYVRDFPGAEELTDRIMRSERWEEGIKVLDDFLREAAY